MKPLRYRPAAPLDRFVDCFWWSRRETPQTHWEYLLPSGHAQLVFALHDAPLTCVPCGDAVPLVWTGSLLHGPQRRYYAAGPKPCGAVVGVSFRPGGVGAMLGIAAAGLADSHVGLDALWGHRARLLREELLGAPTPVAMFRILERRLAEPLRWSLAMHPAVAQALSDWRGVALHERPAAGLRVGDVGGARGERGYGGYSAKHFIACFREAVGMTPKHYLRIQRLNDALRALARDPRPPLADVAARAGYADQSHFTRECRELAGCTPNRYRALDAGSPLHHVVGDTIREPRSQVKNVQENRARVADN